MSNIWVLLGGQGVVVTALITWIGKLWFTRLLQSEKIKLQAEFNEKLMKQQAYNESRIHVGKIQFEREYEAYENIWKLASEASSCVQKLGKSKDNYELYEIAIEEFSVLKSSLGELVTSKFPFIDSNVYDQSYLCVQLNQEFWALADKHFYYLEDKLLEEKSKEECIEREEAFEKVVDLFVTRNYKVCINISLAIKARNEKMLVI